ncbi:D-alanyl-D-alanine carboxypeptidase family protein [Lapidilactobacillus achengensis]|uniref:D-alanyl-D-alanine carboxypeptidase family protein n=1 Tax=Lapidilactobacillus achengensis TaxID=2486000 RepID=A0ABW1UPW8_9LACO|nr:M15 family metallopeptidase [Lapidilactobacillus achengensis]
MHSRYRQNKLIVSFCAVLLGLFVLLGIGLLLHDHQQHQVFASLDIQFSARETVPYGAKVTSADLINKMTPGAHLKKASKLNTKRPGRQELTFVISKNGVDKQVAHRVEVQAPEKLRRVKPYQLPKSGSVKASYYRDILLVNKTHPVPETFGGPNATAEQALLQLQDAARKAGYQMPQLSGYRSYATQQQLYQDYVQRDGVAAADRYSSRPGFSEHQTGLAYDVGVIDDQYGQTPAGQWLAQHCAQFGFIIRFPQGKEAETGYQYEPWHIRYLGVTVARQIMTKQITLEAYLDQVELLTTGS